MEFNMDKLINFNPVGSGVAGLDEKVTRLFREISKVFGFPIDLIRSTRTKKPKGVLLHGQPGTGKTTFMKRVVIPFFKKLGMGDNITFVKSSDIFNFRLGDSEHNMNKILNKGKEQAQKAKGGKIASDDLTILFFEEIDAICQQRMDNNAGGDGINTANRVLSILLEFMDGLDDNSNVIIFGTTNRLESIDKALIRAGRMDIIVNIPLPNTQGRFDLFKLMLKPLAAHASFTDEQIQQLATETAGFTGADIQHVIDQGMNTSLFERLEDIRDIQKARPTDEERRIKPKVKVDTSVLADKTTSNTDEKLLQQSNNWYYKQEGRPLFVSGKSVARSQLVGVSWCPYADDFLQGRIRTLNGWHTGLATSLRDVLQDDSIRNTPMGKMTKEQVEIYLDNPKQYANVQSIRFCHDDDKSEYTNVNYRFAGIRLEMNHIIEAIIAHRRTIKNNTSVFCPRVCKALCARHEPTWAQVRRFLTFAASKTFHRPFLSAFVHGARKSGKSTLICSTVQELKNHFPMVYNIDFGEWLPMYSQERILELLRQYIHQAEYQSCNSLLLIDGVDRLDPVMHASILYIITEYMTGARYSTTSCITPRIEHVIITIVIGSSNMVNVDKFKSSSDVCLDVNSLILHSEEHEDAMTILKQSNSMLTHTSKTILDQVKNRNVVAGELLIPIF